MPAQRRFKTEYKGVTYIEGTSPLGKPERIYYIRFRKDGKIIEEKAGRQSQGMTPARASQKRAAKISGQQSTNEERRQAEMARKIEEEGRWTIAKLFDTYIAARAPGKAMDTDTQRFNKYLKEPLGDKEPKDLNPMEIDRLRLQLAKTLAPQTVKHVLNLLTWLVNHGINNGYCEGIPFKIKKPPVDNKKTEFLTDDQFKRLMEILDEYENRQVANLMKLAAFTGIRRGGLLDLQWSDIDFERGFITIRNKGGRDEILPMNDMARKVLEFHPRPEFEYLPGKQSPYVFPGRYGKRRATVQVACQDIAQKAGLPEDFRPLHGLRHHFASTLASSGKVDMYVLQRLMCHKTPVMTQRYAHLHDEAMRRGADVAAEVLGNSISNKETKVLSIGK
jgi:integrase